MDEKKVNQGGSKKNEGKKMIGMITTIRPNAAIVECSKAKEFISSIVKNKTTKQYWDECSSTSRKLDSSIIEEMIRKSRDEK